MDCPSCNQTFTTTTRGKTPCSICGQYVCNTCKSFVRYDPNNSLITLPIKDWHALCNKCAESDGVFMCSYCYNILPRRYYLEGLELIVCADCGYPDFQGSKSGYPYIEIIPFLDDSE
jgi:hypothetical protein